METLELEIAQRARFYQIDSVEIRNGFESVNFVSRNPASFFVSAFITQPTYQVLQFTLPSLVNLRVEDT